MDEQVNGNDENYKEYINIDRYSRTDGCSKVNDLLGGHSVEHYLQQESTKHRQADEPISWYHGKITREVSEQIIQEGIAGINNQCSCIILARLYGNIEYIPVWLHHVYIS